MFRDVARNKRITAYIFVLVFSLFALTLFYTFFLIFGVFELRIWHWIIAAIICLAVAGAGSFCAFWYSHKIMLRVHRAKPATFEQHKKLHNIMKGICIASGIWPELYVMDEPALNAFATGRNHENSVICVTTGLIEALDYYQLEGVIAHEMAHIKNYDMLLQTVAVVMLGATVMLSDFALTFKLLGGSAVAGSLASAASSAKGRVTAPVKMMLLFVGLIFLLLTPIFCQLLKMALGRNREFLADATSVEFTRNPEGLASALEVMDHSLTPMWFSSKACDGLYTVTPNIFATKYWCTHPPIEERTQRLRSIK